MNTIYHKTRFKTIQQKPKNEWLRTEYLQVQDLHSINTVKCSDNWKGKELGVGGEGREGKGEEAEGGGEEGLKGGGGKRGTRRRKKKL